MAHYYVEVLVASPNYHGSDPLTYESTQLLKTGQVVSVPLRGQTVLAVVAKVVGTPTFATKPVSEVWPLPALPNYSLPLVHWLQWYYRAPLGVSVGNFLPKNLSPRTLTSFEFKPTKPPTHEPTLTAEQQKVLSSVVGPGTYLLHGETGSGKTRVYMELCAAALAKGCSAIVLTPEISLTSQLEQSFAARFKGQIVVMHSQLTEAERRKIWLSLLKTRQPVIVIGARSALFSPLTKLGLIIVDECHESAYKQDQAPRYNALRLASKLSQLTDSVLIMGSATPSVVDYYVAQQKKIPILRMSQLARAETSVEPSITLIDLKDHDNFSRSTFLADPLIENIKEALSAGEQILLYLNRRGTARVIICRECGWQATCPRCDLPLVYHGDDHSMRCHTCSFRQPSVSACPVCQSPDITFYSVGTKAVANEVSRLFPEAQVQRFDTDNTPAERFTNQYQSVVAGGVDILVGTQSLAKGLDLPKLSVVGVVMADTPLAMPDFSASERMYQLLRQVIGRVARGHRHGKVVVQSFNPTSPILQAAIKKDWDSFYEREISERKQFNFPPFCFLLKLNCRRKSSASAQKAATALASQLTNSFKGLEIIGPSPSFHSKVAGLYAWQLVIKSPDRARLLEVVDSLPQGWTADLDPDNLL